MRSIWLLLFALLSIFCFSSLPVANAQGGEAEDYDDVVDDDEEVEYVDDDEDEDEEQDEDEEEEDEEEYTEEDDFEEIGPSDDVITISLLPDYPDKRMIVGEEVLVLMNFVNKGESKFNLTEVGAFLHSPFDFNYYMHNFTAKPLANAIVEPGTHFSVEYSFTPEVNLIDGSLEYTMSTYLMYNSTGDEPEQFKSTVFNKTVTLIEPPNSVDIKRFFTRFLLIAGVGLLIYIGVGVFNKNRSKKSDSKVERGTKSLDSMDDSWEFKKYVPKQLSVKRGSKKRSGKRKKKLSKK